MTNVSKRIKKRKKYQCNIAAAYAILLTFIYTYIDGHTMNLLDVMKMVCGIYYTLNTSFLAYSNMLHCTLAFSCTEWGVVHWHQCSHRQNDVLCTVHQFSDVQNDLLQYVCWTKANATGTLTCLLQCCHCLICHSASLNFYALSSGFSCVTCQLAFLWAFLFPNDI